jgi:hypothetical protein
MFLNLNSAQPGLISVSQAIKAKTARPLAQALRACFSSKRLNDDE